MGLLPTLFVFADMQRALLGTIVVVACLSGCAPRVADTERDIARPAGFPEHEYRRAASEGRPVLRVDPATSVIVVEVRRAGSLARLGHDHVVASHDVRGYVLPDAQRADLYVPLDRLIVDEPALRAEAGFNAPLSEDIVAATRQNMLDKVLDTRHSPFAEVHVLRLDDDARAVDVTIALHGVSRQMRIPVRIERDAAALDVSGSVALAQTDFGIVPLSILGGAIQVQDRVDLRFRIHANRSD